MATKKFQRSNEPKDIEKLLNEQTSVILNAVDEKLGKIEKQISNLVTKDEFNNLVTSVDKYAKKADAYFQEMVMLSHKVDRQEKWIFQIAKKLKIKLEY